MRILLDAALEVVNHNGNTPPHFRVPALHLIDLSMVDAILLSTSYSALALPYITEYTSFKGQVYATDPTVEFAGYENHAQLSLISLFTSMS